MERKEENNIFKYATKELSQDAFICWLINWFNTTNETLKKIAEKFLKEVILKDTILKEDKEFKIETVKVVKQYKSIDVLIIVNEEYYIIIEDKILSKQHTKGKTDEPQLKSYIEEIIKVRKNNKNKREFVKKNIIPVYYKMFDEYFNDEDKKIPITIEKEVTIINRKDMYKFFKENDKNIKNSKSEILRQYKEYIDYLRESLDGADWKKTKISEWHDILGYYDKFVYEYNRKANRDKRAEKKVYGNTYIDWYEKDFNLEKFKKNNNIKSKISFKKIYLALKFDKRDDIKESKENYKISICARKIGNKRC